MKRGVGGWGRFEEGEGVWGGGGGEIVGSGECVRNWGEGGEMGVGVGDRG